MSTLTRLTRLSAAPAAVTDPVAPSSPAKAPAPATSIRLTRLDDRIASGIRRGFEAAATRLLDRPGAASSGEPPASAPTAAFSGAVRGRFDQADTNGNGYLSRAEVARAGADPAITGVDSAAMIVLERHQGELRRLSDDEFGPELIGVSRADLQALDRLPKDHSLAIAVRSGISGVRFQAQVTDRRLFPEGLASIRGEAVEQGQAGTCYFLAALSGLADTNPQAIRDMISENADGSFTVDFPRGGPVTVSAPSDGEIGSYATGGRYGLWVSVMEKAFAERRGQQRLGLFASDYRAASGGGNGEGIRALTGGADTRLPRLMSDSRLLDAVRTAQTERRVMTGAIFGLPRIAEERNGLPARHVYTVQGVTDEGRIRIRNPWGSGGPAGDGIHELTPAEFKRTIDVLSFEEA